jgi:acyl-CoA thioesterase
MSEFDTATALTRAGQRGTYEGRFTDGWMIGSAVNGGLVMATALRALGARLAEPGDGWTEPRLEPPPPAHPDPVVMSAYFMTASAPGPVTVTTDVLRRGRQLSTGQVSVLQEGLDGEPVERMRALASFGDLADVDVESRLDRPDLPPPERCVSSDQAPPEFLKFSSFLDRLDLRIDPATAGWAVGKPSGRGELRGWLRLRDGREPDTTVLMLALDAMPPVAFDLGIFGWTPTLEFTGHVRARPAPGWLQVSLTSAHLGGGTLEEDATIWDSTGRLVAHSRQLCGVQPTKGAR